MDALPGHDPRAVLLQVDHLHVEFRTRDGVAKAVNGASFHVSPGETLALLGESGCGKSVTAQAVMGILDTPPAHITGGQILYRGIDLLRVSEEDRRKVRANRISMIFQDALSALNPVYSVGFQLAELFRKQRGMSRKDAKQRAIELLDQVRIPAARERINDYPHQFSGGMRQRVMIAMALALDPEVLIADEPTTALDVTVQAQIMGLLAELQRERNMGLILITHDMGVVADVADRISVMYAGKIVEEALVQDIYAHPAHPYTKALLESIPRLDLKGQQLNVIRGLPPALTDIPRGCAFHPRCGYARQICHQEEPPGYRFGQQRVARCHFIREVLGV
jgi:oligopeptide transport system ATP-binding protein